jgi:hypothetical protein
MSLILFLNLKLDAVKAKSMLLNNNFLGIIQSCLVVTNTKPLLFGQKQNIIGLLLVNLSKHNWSVSCK